MSEEIDDLKSEIRERNEDLDKQIYALRSEVKGLFKLLLTGQADKTVMEMLALQETFEVDRMFLLTAPRLLHERVSFLEMKVGRRVAEEVEYDGPLHQYDIDNNSAYCLGAPQCEEQPNLNVTTAAVTPPIYVIQDINRADQIRDYIRLNECHLTDEQALDIQGQMARMIEAQPTDRCAFCGNIEPYHHLENAICVQFISTTDEQSESLADDPCIYCSHQKKFHGKKCTGPMPIIGGNPQASCGCRGFAGLTKASQSESYSKSAQSEPSPQYEERQSSSRFLCKFQHGQTVANLLVHMGNTSESNHPATLAQLREQFSHTWLALWKCGEAECQSWRMLVAQVLNNPRLE